MSIDAKRDEYRKYLERTGAMDALTKVLVALYEESEKPEDSVAYIKRNLGGFSEEADLVSQLEKANARIKELEEQLAGMAPPTPAPAEPEPQESEPAAHAPAPEQTAPESEAPAEPPADEAPPKE